MKKKEKNILFYFLSFLIPLIFFIIILLFKQILTGKFTLVISDLEYQYYPLLIHLKRCFSGTSNLFYSFSAGLGSSMIGTLSYYLMSAFNLIVLLFDINNIYIATIIIILAKFSLSGLTMFLFLKYHFKDKKNIYLLLFSTAYAVSLFNVANYFQIIWFDVIMLAPLLLLGIDKIVDKNKPLLYGIILFLIILTNYYMGYMCCIFSVLYFLYRILLSKEKYKSKKFKTFIIISILAGLMTMVISLPTVIRVLELNRNIKEMPFFNIDILGIFSKTFIGSHASKYILNTTHPFLYCGIFVIPLLFFYFFNKKITKKERIVSFIFLLIFVISVLINPINNFWHVFSSPVGFNYRYTYLFIIFILYLSCKSFFNLKYIKKELYYIVALILPILGLVIYFRKLVPLFCIYVTVFLGFLYLLIFYNFKKNKDLKIILILLVLAELYFNMHYIFLNLEFSYQNGLMGRYNEKTSSVEYINEYDKSPFYRIEFKHNYGANDPLYNGYRGSSVWLSSISVKKDFFAKIGYVAGSNQYNYNDLYVLDAIFGIKYLETTYENNIYEEISNKQVSLYDGILYDTIKTTAVTYKNPYALSIGYMIDGKTKLECDRYVDCQNVLLKSLTGNDISAFEEVEVNEFSFINSNNLDFYLDFTRESDNYFSYKIYINDEFYDEHDSNTFGLHLVTNKYELNEKINIRIEMTKGENPIKKMQVYYNNFDNFIKQIDTLKQNQIEVTEFKDGYIKGNINTLKDGTLFLTIPYETGWNIYIDGKKVDYYEVYDTFIGLDLETGNHEIEMIYQTPGIKLGSIISIGSFILFITYIYINKKTIID